MTAPEIRLLVGQESVGPLRRAPVSKAYAHPDLVNGPAMHDVYREMTATLVAQERARADLRLLDSLPLVTLDPHRPDPEQPEYSGF